MKTYKKGISLIVLVITVIVLAILATTVIISLSNTNIITQTTKTTFKANIAGYKEALNLYLASELAGDDNFKFSSLNVSYEDDADTFVEIFGDVPENYRSKLKVANGGLVYETENLEEIEILSSMDVAISVASPEEWFTNCTYTYVNPIVAAEYIDKPCFDTATGTLYSVNLPDGVTTVTIPEEINGVKVKAISGFNSDYDKSESVMPVTLEKVILPAGIALKEGAFIKQNGTIDIVAAGPIKLDTAMGCGPIASVSSNSKIEVLDGNKVYYTMFDGISIENIIWDNVNVEIIEGWSLYSTGLLEAYKISDKVYDIPENFSKGFWFTVYVETLERTDVTFYISQGQLDEILEHASENLDENGDFSIQHVEGNKYRAYMATGPAEWHETPLYIIVR